MKTITQMKEAVEGLLQQIGDIDAKCTAEEREYTDEEKKLIKQIQVRIHDLKDKIELQEDTARLAKEAEKSVTPPTKVDPNDGSGQQRAAITATDPSEQFRSMSEFFGAVIIAEVGHRVDPRLSRYDERETRVSGLGEGVGSEGGFLVPPNFAQELLQNVWEDPEVLAKVSKITLTTGNSLTMPRIVESSRADGSRQGGVQMYWTGEGKTKTASKPDFGQVELKLKKLTGLVYLTDVDRGGLLQVALVDRDVLAPVGEDNVAGRSERRALFQW